MEKRRAITIRNSERKKAKQNMHKTITKLERAENLVV